MIETVDAARCIGCGLCVKVCPLDVLRMAPDAYGRLKARIVYRDECQSCFLCEVYCPVDALYVSPQRSPLHAVWPSALLSGTEGIGPATPAGQVQRALDDHGQVASDLYLERPVRGQVAEKQAPAAQGRKGEGLDLAPPVWEGQGDDGAGLHGLLD